MDMLRPVLILSMLRDGHKRPICLMGLEKESKCSVDADMCHGKRRRKVARQHPGTRMRIVWQVVLQGLHNHHKTTCQDVTSKRRYQGPISSNIMRTRWLRVPYTGKDIL